MGKYREQGMKELENLEFSGNYKTAELSLKVLDVLSEETELSVKTALLVLDDAKQMLLQLLGI